ncbi:MAG: TonB-dependent receptor [Pseudohongiellaceae bacterium]
MQRPSEAMTRRASYLTLLAALLSSSPVWAQNNDTDIRTLLVIGQRGEARSEVDAAAPVDVFSQQDLRALGATGNELGEALASIAPSFSFPRQSNSVTSDHIRAARLRNLSPDQVLVLVNGKRRHPSAVINDNTTFGKGSNAFDFNTIPLSAVERVEILRDGASAQYGSDAIAGVINIVLRDDAEGTEAVIGTGVHLSDSPILNASDVDGETVYLTAQHGLRYAGDGHVRFGGELRSRNSTDRAGRNRVPGFVAPPTINNLAFRGQRTSRSGDPQSEEARLWANGGYRINDTMDFYYTGTWLNQDTEGAVLFRHPDSSQNVPELYPRGTLPVTTGDNRDFGLSTGLALKLADWELDLGLSHGRNRFNFGVRNSLNPSLGPQSPTRFHSGRFRMAQTQVQLDALRQLEWQNTPFTLATGAAWRHEEFSSRPGDPASHRAGDYRFTGERLLADGSQISAEALLGLPDIGAQGAKGLTPDDATTLDRNVYSLYAELSSQVTEALFISGATRYEDYDDFGDTLTAKLSTNLRINPVLAVRGSVSNSFRAPSLSQLAWSRSDNTFDRETFERISSRLVRSDSAIGQTLGVEDLREEQAGNASLGLTIQAADRLQLTIDAFRIDIDDRISISESLQGENLIATVQDVPGGDGVRSVSFFTNAIDTRSEGVELVADWSDRWGSGQYRVNAASSFIDTSIRRLREAPPRLRKIDPGAQLFESGARNVLTTASPEHQAVVSFDWQNDEWLLHSQARYYGTVERDRGFASQIFSPDTLFDVSVTRQFGPSWGLTLGADNVFDRRAQRSNESLDFGGNFAYEVITPAGANGRFLWTRIEMQF